LYREKEVELSETWLNKIFKQQFETCLIGGWAVYESINKQYEEDKGRLYIGSKDIDLGFHIDPNWSLDQIKNSHYLKLFNYLEKNNFNWVGYRFMKGYDYETLRELSKDEIKKKPMYEVVEFFIDPIVDYVNPLLTEKLLINPIDEPLLAHTFKEKLVKEITINPQQKIKATIPLPEILLAMKLNSVGSRTKDHKRIKDITDIYALIWYSEYDIKEIREKTSQIKELDQTKLTISKFKEEEINQAAKSIDVNPSEMSTAFDLFTRL
jgi:hypothetical protein